jgi:hypothetical protein
VHPLLQFKKLSGVFITAIVLALIALKWTEKYLPGNNTNLIYGGLVFFGVLLFYALDYLFDLIKVEQNNNLRQTYHLIPISICIFSAFSCGFFLALGINDIDLKHFYLFAIPVAFYIIFALLKSINVRGIKEILIALTVTITLVYPFLETNNYLYLNLGFPLLIVSLLNLLLFGFFEKEKDELHGFKSLYAGWPQYRVFKHLFYSFLTLSILAIAMYFFVGKIVFPFWLIIAIYWLAIVFRKNIQSPKIYRWLLDLILLILVFI